MAQTFAMFFTASKVMKEIEESFESDALDDILNYFHNRMQSIESYTLIPLIFISIIFGFLYELCSRRTILCIGFTFIPLSLALFWSNSFGMIIGARILVGTGC